MALDFFITAQKARSRQVETKITKIWNDNFEVLQLVLSMIENAIDDEEDQYVIIKEEWLTEDVKFFLEYHGYDFEVIRDRVKVTWYD